MTSNKRIIFIALAVAGFAWVYLAFVLPVFAENETPAAGATPTATPESEDKAAIKLLNAEELNKLNCSEQVEDSKLQAYAIVLDTMGQGLTISAEVLVVGPLKIEGKEVKTPEFQITSSPSVNGSAEMLLIKLNNCSDLNDGTYSAFLVVSATAEDDGQMKVVDVIYQPFSLQVGEKDPDKQEIDPEKTKAVSPAADTSYNLSDLMAGKDQITAVIQNGGEAVTVTGSVFFPLMDEQIFTEPVSDTIKAGGFASLPFCLPEHSPDETDQVAQQTIMPAEDKTSPAEQTITTAEDVSTKEEQTGPVPEETSQPAPGMNSYGDDAGSASQRGSESSYPGLSVEAAIEDGKTQPEEPVSEDGAAVEEKIIEGCSAVTILDPEPEPGEYQGFVVLSYGDKKNTVEMIPINLMVRSAQTVPAWASGRLEERSQQLFGLSLGSTGIKLVTIVAGIFLALLILWLLKKIISGIWWLSGRPGTVEINLTDQSGGTDLKPEGEKAYMQERLEAAGLRPPAQVPGGSLGGEIDTFVQISEIISTKWIATLVGIFWRTLRARPGHQVNGTFLVREGEPAKGLAIEIVDIRSGKVDETRVIWAESHREAVESAAYFVYYFITSQHRYVRRRIPVWACFPTAASFEQYQRGLRLQADGRYVEAKKVLRQAADMAPNNAVVRFHYGNLMENHETFRMVDAMEAYLEILDVWGNDVPEAHYRLGAVFSFADELMDEWQKLKPNEKEKLLALIKSVCGTDFFKAVYANNIWQINRDCFLNLAKEQWRELCQILAVPWSRFKKPHIKEPVTRRSFIEMAILCADLKLGHTSHIEARADSILERWPGNWQVRYNAACLYAIWMGVLNGKTTTSQITKKHFEDKAFRYLREVLRDKESTIGTDWLFNDPDLKKLTDTPHFKALIGEREIPKSDKQEKVEGLCHSWDVLKGVAAKQEEVWYNRWQTVRQQQDWTWDELEPWYQEEMGLWGEVRTLAYGAAISDTRNAFWEAYKQLRSEAGDMPKAAKACTEDRFDDHNALWKELYSCADKWHKQLENVPGTNLKKWVWEQWTIWRAVRYLANSPLEDALLKRVKKKICKK